MDEGQFLAVHVEQCALHGHVHTADLNFVHICSFPACSQIREIQYVDLYFLFDLHVFAEPVDSSVLFDQSTGAV
ncbi:hypothetical protein D3C74_473400 [compost metagenome]